MERKLNKIIENYVIDLKNNVRDKIISLNMPESSKVNELIEHIYEHKRLQLSKDDLVKPKRVKNQIPVASRCNARRANCEQCTRRKKPNNDFCGTHSKGTPNGLINVDNTNTNALHTLEVVAEDIGGIVYYIDKYNNVYKTEDILKEKTNPEVIAKWVMNTNGLYEISNYLE